jgi:hypothetical protein
VTYIPRCPDFNCPRLTRSATEPLLTCSRLLKEICLAAAATNAMLTQKPATKFGPMFFCICMKIESKNIKYTTCHWYNSIMSMLKQKRYLVYAKRRRGRHKINNK